MMRGSRQLGAAALVISMAACGQDGTPPTQPSIIAITPTPTPIPPVPPTSGGGIAVSGIVLEFTPAGDRLPVANLRLQIRAPGPTDGALGGAALPDVVTEADGRFTIPDVSAHILFVRTAPGSAYRFLCEFYPLWVRASPPFTDLPVVHVGWSVNRLPPNMSIAGTSIYGMVSERVDGSVRPVSGAAISFGGTSDPDATTNDSGFYMLCSVVGSDQTRTITVSKSGYTHLSRNIGPYETKVDLELTRQ